MDTAKLGAEGVTGDVLLLLGLWRMVGPHTTFVNEWSVGLFATSKLRITQTVIDVLPMQPVTYTRNLLNPTASFSPHKSVIKS